jgi:hypothetical protein
MRDALDGIKQTPEWLFLLVVVALGTGIAVAEGHTAGRIATNLGIVAVVLAVGLFLRWSSRRERRQPR